MSAIANLVVFQFIESAWKPLLPKDTPAWLKEPDAVADLVDGAILEAEGEYFRAYRLGDSPLILSNPPVRVAGSIEVAR